MSLNNLGLGFMFTAKDLASGVMGDVKKHLLEVEGVGVDTAKSIKESFAVFGTGLAIMGTGLAALGGISEAVEHADDFQKATALVSTRVSEAEFPMARIVQLTNDLSAQFGLMPIDEAKTLYEAVAAGARDAASATGLMTAANELAVGTHSDLKESMGEVSQVAKVFGVDLSHSARIADELFAASKHVEGGLGEMGAMLEHLGPTAASAGLTMSELLAVVADMETAGIRGRPALGGLKAVLDSLIKPTSDATVEAARLGIAWDTATLQSKGLPAILDEIAASGRMNSTTLEKLFGNTEAATVAMALMRNEGGDLRKMLGEVEKSTGAAAAAADLMIQPDERFRALNAQVTNLVGDALLPARDAFLEFLNGIMTAFTKLDPSVIRFFMYIVGGAAALAVLVGGTIAVTAAFTLLSAGAEAAGISVGELGATIWATLSPLLPFIAVGALAVAAFKVAFDNNFGGIADTAREVYDDLSLVFTSLVELFSGGGFTEDTWQKLEKHSGIRDFAISVYGWVSRIGEFFMALGRGFAWVLGRLSPLFGAIGGGIESLVDAFSELSGPKGAEGAAAAFDTFSGIGEFVGDLLGSLFTVLGMVLQVIVATAHVAVSVVTAVVNTIEDLFSGIGDVFFGIAELFDGIVHGDWSKAWQGFKMIVFSVVDSILGMLLHLVGAVGGVVDAIAGMFGKKPEWQKGINDFRDFMHNQMSGDFGVSTEAGRRGGAKTTTEETPGMASFAAPPPPSPLASFASPAALASFPGAASVGAAPPAGGLDFGALSEHLDQIARNTSESGPPTHVTVVLDGEVVGKASTKAKKGHDTRSFTPAPIPE